jgi:hypothetical protein
VFFEFAGFLESMGQGLEVESATDLDVIAFIQGSWLPAHKANCRTRMGSEGEKVASASAIKGIIQQLAKSYSMMGRRDAEIPPSRRVSKITVRVIGLG